jgi:hypothetical protein
VKYRFFNFSKLNKLKGYVIQHMDVLKPGGVSWSFKAKDWQKFLCRKQVQMVSVGQGMTMLTLRSEVQDARGSSSYPLLFFERI